MANQIDPSCRRGVDFSTPSSPEGVRVVNTFYPSAVAAVVLGMDSV